MGEASLEVERFIVDNRLDEKAALNLRAEPPHIQRAVIDRGSLAECLNPSSAVIGRIRDAKLEAKYGTSGRSGGAVPAAAPVAQAAVYQPAVNQAFPQAMPQAIPQAITQAMPQAVPQAMQVATAAPMAGFQVYGVPGAMHTVAGYDPAVANATASAVASGYGMAALPGMTPDGRIADPAMMANWAMYGVMQTPGQMPGQIVPQMPGQVLAQMPGQLPQVAQVAPMAQVTQVGMQAYGQQPMMQAMQAMQVPMMSTGMGFAPAEALPQMTAALQPAALPAQAAVTTVVAAGASRCANLAEVETFISTSRLDETAARNLRAEPPHIQAAVIDRGTLAECYNPSSALIGRIRDAKLEIKYGRSHAAGPAPLGAPSSGLAAQLDNGSATTDVERFISENLLDEKAATNLRQEPPQIQRAVIDRGSLRECTNPSSALIGRIRDAKLQVKYGSSGPMDPLPSRAGGVAGLGSGGNAPDIGARAASANSQEGGSKVEQFIAENRLDEGAARALRAELPDVQNAVMDRGSLMACANPSSAVMGRIRDAKLQRPTGSYITTITASGDRSRYAPY
mmetsp:Transcript_33240/g.91593  ORF Transcript_33240/g.91593 Transcript_33240/m.91593 type:complete len:566 (+) Transcript_33240:217-1914(+)